MITQANYLDFGNLIVNELVGSFWLTFFIGWIIIIFVSVKKDLKEQTAVLLLLIYSTSISAYYSNSMILAVVGLVFSFTIYGVMAKYMNR